MLTVSGGLCAQSLITYHHYLDYSTEWNEQTIFYGFQDYYYYEMYKLTQDTLINDTAYYKIKEKTNEVGNSSINYTTPYAGALRETEDGKIYYRPNDANTEYLLFDFGTAYQIGDTTNTGCVVAAIDTVYFGNEARRRYETHPPDAPEFSNYLVEGIGIVSENAQVPSGFLNSWGFGYCGQMFDVSSTLLCFRNSQGSYGNCIVSDYFDSILLPPLDTLHLSTNLNQSTNPTTVPLPASTIISSHSTPQHGLFFWSNFNAHQFIYVPFLDYVGNDEFYFVICDTNDPTDCINLQVNIIVGDQTANPDLSYTFINTTDTINVLLNDIHTETPLLYIQTPPTHGTIHYAQNEGIYDLSPCDYSGEPAPPIVPTMAGNNAIVYTPNPDFIGVDTFVYVLSRACLGGDTAQVIVHTSNIAPISPVPLYVNYNTPTQAINLGLPASTFINNTPTAPQLGTLTWVDANTFIYTPALDVLGGDEFTLQVCDQNNPNNCIAVTVYVLIANGNANPDISYTLTNTSDTIDVTANDTGAASLIYLQTPPAHGTVHYTHNENVYNVGPCLWSMLPPFGLNTLAGTADVDAIIYTPDPGFVGIDTFVYVSSPGCFGGDTAQVIVHVGSCEDCIPQIPQQMSTCQDGRWINIPLCPYINNATLTAPNDETVSLINNNYLYINQTGNYTIQYNSTICGAGSTTFNLLIDDDCVFPGDINYDNIANMDDLLDWGLIPMDATGAPRDTATLNWQAQACIDWANTQANGSNYKHADCNGNGIKDITDPNAITLNYHQTHNGNQAGKTEDEDYTLSAIPIYNPMANNYVDFEIGVQANNNLPLPNIYGIRFDVKYQGDILMVDALFDNYCLGTPNVDMIGLQKYYATDSLLHIGMTRLNLQDVSPQTPLCKVGCLIGTPIIGQIYTTNPNAGSGKTEDYIPVDSITLCLNNVRLLDKNGYETPIGTKIVWIWYDVIPDAAISINNNTNVSVFPNPANQQLNIIYHSLSHPNATFVLYDMLGQQVLSQPITALNTTTLNTSTLPVGVYTYQLWANKNEILQKGKVVVCR